MEKWISIYGNALNIAENKPAMYAKNITLRYPILAGVDGKKVRLTLDNYVGTDDVTITEVTVAKALNNLDYVENSCVQVTFNSENFITIPAGKKALSDEIEIEINKGEKLMVSIYLADFTQLRSGVVTSGPYSIANYALGNQSHTAAIDHSIYKPTEYFYFLSTVDVLSESDGGCVLCYGDSITSQNWPEELQLLFLNDGSNRTVIRRAVSGARILHQYEALQYQHYGLSAENRVGNEMNGSAVDTVIILQGVNDLIHPVGVETNEFRPWSDLPTVEQLTDGIKYLVNSARKNGYRALVGTILPIEGWRTYQPFRNELREQVNAWIRTTDEIDGFIDFDEVMKDENNSAKLAAAYNSGDNLHPSANGYKCMAKTAYKYLNKS